LRCIQSIEELPLTDDRQKLIELLRQAERLADRLKEGIAGHMIKMALMELNQPNPR
jgi:hypothetical protein